MDAVSQIIATQYHYTRKDLLDLRDCLAVNSHSIASGLEAFFSTREEAPTADEAIGLWLRHAERILSEPGYIDSRFSGELVCHRISSR